MEKQANQEIESTIRSFIDSNLLFGNDELNYSDDSSLLSEGIVDSLGAVDLVAFLQKRYKIKIGQQEVRPDNFDSVAKIAAFVRRKTNTPTPSAE
jgi:acyl carrier protein